MNRQMATGAEPSMSVTIDGVETPIDELPWWRRPRRLRRQLVGTFVFVAFTSVAIIGGLNFVAARGLLNEGTQDQLVGVGEARARSIESGVARTLGQVSAMAADLAVVVALEDLDEAFRQLDAELDDAQSSALDDAYQQDLVTPIEEAGLGPVTVAELRPQSDAGLYLQFHYTLPGIGDPASRRAIVDPGDGSAYTDVHATDHPYLVGLAESLGAGDLMLVSASGDIVYSVDKRVDYGTSLRDGPYRDAGLADAVLERLSRVRVGDAVLVDQELYLPAAGRPTIFVAAGVRRDTRVIGALVVEIPIEALNAITTAGGEWEKVGLKDGESYAVGSDLLLRSESREWIEDPDRYLGRVDDDALVDLMGVFGSPVGLQPVDTQPVRRAIEGATFEGTSENYLGQRTFSYATPIDIPGVTWVMVADVPLDDARAPLFDYLKQLGLVLLIILPVAALLGAFMADRLTRPIPPVVDAALTVAEGERDPDLPDLGRDEFGDLARRLGHMATELGRQEAALAEEYESRRELLLTVLPPRMVRTDGEVSGKGEAADTATVVAVSIDVTGGELEPGDEELADLLGQAAQLSERLAAERGVERIRAAADRYLFVAGVGDDDDGADSALDLADQITIEVTSLAESVDVTLAIHVGVSSGPVATGLLEQGNLTFGAWGEPVRRALAIGSFATSDEILVDASTAAAASPDRWSLQPATDVVALDGEPMVLFSLGD